MTDRTTRPTRTSRTSIATVKKFADERKNRLRRLHVEEGLNFKQIGELEGISRERVRSLIRLAGVSREESQRALRQMVLCRHCGLPFLARGSQIRHGRAFMNADHYRAYISGVRALHLPTLLRQPDGSFLVQPRTPKPRPGTRAANEPVETPAPIPLERYVAERVLGRALQEGERVKLLDESPTNMALDNILFESPRRRARTLAEVVLSARAKE